MLKKLLPSVDYLNECFSVLDDGVLIWKNRPIHHFKHDLSMRVFNKKYAGNVAGKRCKINGYIDITVSEKKFKAHRIVFLMKIGQIPDHMEIDHVNGVRWDNSPKNLRLATRYQNMCNIRIKDNNHSGFKGVDWNKKEKKWRAKIGVNGVSILIGHFDSAELASKALSEVRAKYHGNFANNGIHTGELN